jgi:hypothetical protein
MLTISLCIISCSSKQVAEYAYGSVKNNECLNKTGDISCDLNKERYSDVSLIVPPNNNSNEALEKRASKIRESQK